VVFSPQVTPLKRCMHVSCLLYMLHALPISVFFTCSSLWYLVISTELTAPRYVVCHLVLLKSKYPPQYHILENPQSTFLPQCERPSFTPIQKTSGKIIVLNILIFTFLDSKLEDKRFRTEW
jgi:hypothetical protein